MKESKETKQKVEEEKQRRKQEGEAARMKRKGEKEEQKLQKQEEREMNKRRMEEDKARRIGSGKIVWWLWRPPWSAGRVFGPRRVRDIFLRTSRAGTQEDGRRDLKPRR